MREILFWTIIFSLALWTINNPFVGVMSYSILNVVRPEMFFWGGDAGAESQIILFCVSLIGVGLRFKNLRNEDKTKRIICREIVLWFYIYFAFLLLMPFSSYDVEYSYPYVHEIGKNALLCLLLFLSLTSIEQVIKYEVGLLCAFSFLGLWGIQQHYVGNVRLEGLGGVSWGDSNAVAAMFVLFFPVALSFCNDSYKKFFRIAAIIAGVIIALLIVFTGSRGGFLGLSVALFLFWLKSKKKGTIAMVGGVVFLCSLPFIGDEYWDRMKTISGSESVERDNSASSRLVFWKAGLMLFKDNPILGVGFGAYPEAKLQYWQYFSYLEGGLHDEYFRERNPYVTHNTYLQMLSEGGLIVGVPYFLILGGTFYSNWRVRKNVAVNVNNKKLYYLLSGIEVGLISYCICIIFINSILFFFFPVQTIVCSKIRNLIIADSLQ